MVCIPLVCIPENTVHGDTRQISTLKEWYQVNPCLRRRAAKYLTMLSEGKLIVISESLFPCTASIICTVITSVSTIVLELKAVKSVSRTFNAYAYSFETNSPRFEDREAAITLEQYLSPKCKSFDDTICFNNQSPWLFVSGTERAALSIPVNNGEFC